MIPLWTTSTGLVVAPLVWVINTQLSQILTYVDCQSRTRYSAISTAAAVLCALASAGISWRGGQRTEPAALTLISHLGVLTVLLITFALFLQGAATLLLDACTR